MLTGIALGGGKQTTLKNKHSFNEPCWIRAIKFSVTSNPTLPVCKRSEHNWWKCGKP